MRLSPFYISFLGFVSGVFISSYVYLGIYLGIFLLLLSCAVFAPAFYHSGRTIFSKKIFLYGIFLFFIGIGVVRFGMTEIIKNDPFLDARVGERVSIEGVILAEPEEKEAMQRAVVSFQKIKNGTQDDLRTFGKAVVSLNRFPRFSYGDRIIVSGVLGKPENFKTDNGRDFDYISYLEKDGISYEINFANAKLVKSGEGNAIKAKLFYFKKIFLEKIGSVIPEPQASFAGGLIAGAKKSLPQDLMDDFKTVGIVHIVVLSGYNISLVASAFMSLFAFLPMVFSLALGAVTIVIFAIMTGGTATIVRACIMSLLVILARATGRQYQVSRALFIAGFAMLFHNPRILAFDPSFQLSFAATFGIIFFYPAIEKYFSKIPEKFGLRETIGSTISTQFFLLPLLLYMTGNLSLVALPVNIFVLPFVPLAMLFGFLSGVFAFLGAFAAIPFAFVAHIILSSIIAMSHFASSLPFASINVQNTPIILIVAAYIFYFFVIISSRKTPINDYFFANKN